MKDQLISFETAKLAIQKGWPKFSSICSYNKFGELIKDAGSIFEIPAPTQSLLQKWLRDVHKIFVLILHDGKSFYYQIQRPEWDNCITNFELDTVFTYEEALENGLKKALELI